MCLKGCGESMRGRSRKPGLRDQVGKRGRPGLYRREDESYLVDHAHATATFHAWMIARHSGLLNLNRDQPRTNSVS
jgi:hypothetical protein